MEKNYCIMTKTKEESELAVKALTSHGVYDFKRDAGIMFNAFINFKCEKKVWKAIKKELNLEVNEVYVRFKKEES